MNTEPNDYRNSHLAKGEDYDSDLSKGDFNTYMTQREHVILNRVIDRLFKNKIPRYLDFACGTGRITSYIEGRTDESYGVDLSENMQMEAKKKCKKTQFILQDITREPLSIDDLDMVTAFRFFGNAEDGLRVDVLNALSSKIKSGGYLVFNNHRNPGSLHNRILRLMGEEITVDLSHSKLKRLLKDSGFVIEKTYGIGFWFIMHRMNKPGFMNGSLVKILEPLSLFPPFGSLCPDAIIVAKKI